MSWTTMRSLVLPAVMLSAIGVAAPGDARADDTIRHPGDHPSYFAEIEPHLLVGFGRIGEAGVGVGVRGSFVIVQNGFVSSINNSVAIGVGADVFPGSRVGVVIPVVMQWNFFVHSRWSVFGEPGLALFADGGEVRPVLYVGGRYHFNEHVSLTMRLGYPTASVGVSFW